MRCERRRGARVFVCAYVRMLVRMASFHATRNPLGRHTIRFDAIRFDTQSISTPCNLHGNLHRAQTKHLAIKDYLTVTEERPSRGENENQRKPGHRVLLRHQSILENGFTRFYTRW